MGERIKFYTDDPIAKAVVHGLRTRGIDVVSALEKGNTGATDQHHLTQATLEGRTVVSQDADFLRLHAEGHSHAGIAYARQGTTIGEMVRGLVLIYQILDAEDMKQHVEFL